MKNLLLTVVCGLLMAGCGSSPVQQHRVGAAAPGSVPKVIDVRTPEEFAAGHVTGAFNVPVDRIAEKIKEVEPNKNAPLIVHCRSGNRSARATAALKELGYTNIRDVGTLQKAQEAAAASH